MSFAPGINEPPFYLLTQPLANSSIQSNFAHPVIEYHFADDSPSNLLPKSGAETVIILDYDESNTTPVARSLNYDLTVAGVKVTSAPGAGAARDGEPTHNDRMYIIETLNSTARESSSDISGELDDPQQLLAQFRDRNTILKRILDQPTVKPATSPSEAEATQNSIP